MSEAGVLCQINQFLSLFFMVMVQVVITTEWYVINMPLQVKIFLTVPKNISSVQKIFHAVTAAGDDHAAIPRV